MKSPLTSYFFLLLASYFVGAVVAANAATSTPVAVTPYVFTGRVMDASHAGFDDSRVCSISAYDAKGERLAATKTVFRDGVRDNYALRIPLATAPADSFAVQSDVLTIDATDDSGRTWSGVVANAVCGAAGTVRRVDIVLGEDLDGDHIDDALFEELRDQWEASDYWRAGETFDPNADYDGDGVSTIDEAYAGTNPFEANDVLRIIDYAHAADGARLTFGAVAGRAYTLVSTTNLTNAIWKEEPFALPGEETLGKSVTVPSTRAGGVIPTTLYLLPTEGEQRFFRVRVE